MQITLEKTLCNAIYTLDDVETLQAGLLRQPPRTTIVFADHRRKLDLTMSPDGVTVFVDGLHIDRTIPGAVARCISRHLPADRQMTVRVALRNSITVYSRPVVKFLCRLFDRAPLLQPDLQGCVDTAVAFLSATGEKPDLFRRLGELKTAYVRMLRQAAIAEKQLKDGNTETLMLRGTRLFQIDRQETQRHIARIDAVAMAVFGRLPACFEKAQAFNIDVPSDPQNSIIRIGRLFR